MNQPERDNESGSVHQSISVSKKDIENLISAFKGKLPLQIITVGVNTKIFEESLQNMCDIDNLYKRDLSQITLDELSEELQKEFLSYYKDQLIEYKKKYYKNCFGRNPRIWS